MQVERDEETEIARRIRDARGYVGRDLLPSCFSGGKKKRKRKAEKRNSPCTSRQKRKSVMRLHQTPYHTRDLVLPYLAIELFRKIKGERITNYTIILNDVVLLI